MDGESWGGGAPEELIALRAGLDVDGEVRRVELAEPNTVDDGSAHYPLPWSPLAS